MTKEQQNLIFRYMRTRVSAPRGSIPFHENSEDVLKQLNESLGFNIKKEPHKVAAILEEAIRSHDATEIELALDVMGLVEFQPTFLSLLIEMLYLPWHHSHEDIASWFQYWKAPEPAEVLYHTALVQHEYRAWDENYTLARLCTWALADIGNAEAYAKLQLLAQCDNPLIIEYAQKRIDNWEQEMSRKGG